MSGRSASTAVLMTTSAAIAALSPTAYWRDEPATRRAGHQGLDLGAGAAVPGVRVRREGGPSRRGEEPGERQRERVAAGAGGGRRGGAARAGQVVAAGVRLPRARRAP